MVLSPDFAAIPSLFGDWWPDWPPDCPFEILLNDCLSFGVGLVLRLFIEVTPYVVRLKIFRR